MHRICRDFMYDFIKERDEARDAYIRYEKISKSHGLAVYASDYHPIDLETDQYKDYYLYPSFIKARSSNYTQEAISNWETFMEESIIDDDPENLADITHYGIYSIGILELMQLYYIIGKISEGDALLELYENIRIDESPNDILGNSLFMKTKERTQNTK